MWLIGLLAAWLLACGSAQAAPPEPAAAPTKTIELYAGPEIDRAIEARLRAIYAELEPMRSLEVDVEAGVVRLGGQARSLEAAKDAKAIAERVDGVVAVNSEIRQDAKISDRLQPVFQQMRERVGGWLTYLPLVLVAVGVVVLAWFLAGMFARRSRRDEAPQTFGRLIVEQFVRASIVLIGIAIALEVLGARGLLGAMVGTAGVIGVVLGIAFKNIGETYIASVLLSMRRPFDPNDFVRIDDIEGHVVRLTSRATEVTKLDGTYVSIPNSKVFNASVTNFTRHPQRRISFKLGVGVDADLRRVQELAVTTMAAVPGVLSEPRPECLIEEFGESAIVISVAGWIDQRESSWFTVSSEARRSIQVAFAEADIDVPEPILRVRTTAIEPQ